jgi:hypothetical protein
MASAVAPLAWVVEKTTSRSREGASSAAPPRDCRSRGGACRWVLSAASQSFQTHVREIADVSLAPEMIASCKHP